MALDKHTFYIRTASAAVFALVMLAGMLTTDWAFLVLVGFVHTFCIREFMRLMQKMDAGQFYPPALVVVMQGTGLVLLAMCYFIYGTFGVGVHVLPSALILFMPAPALLFLVGFLSRRSFQKAALSAAMAVFYISLPLAMLLLMRLLTGSYVVPLALILMIWSNDTMAYIVGSFIGRTPFSAISPKKTWEGTIGGALLTIGGAALFGHVANLHGLTYTYIDWMVIALCATVAGTLGDLLESKIKRLANVKDSGSLMPGHGGALDRFDSLLVATPFAFAYVCCFMLH